MTRNLLFAALLLAASASFACEADVLRLNYRKTTTTTKPATQPASDAPKSPTASRATAPLTASTRLEPR